MIGGTCLCVYARHSKRGRSLLQSSERTGRAVASDEFYSDLESFSDFGSVGELNGYLAVPDDWYVLAADIVRSGDAIAQGRYKEVNMIGAAVIAAVLNRLGRDRIPFAFGGDGAMLLVPEKDVQAGRVALAGVVGLARQVMELDLRAAAIPVTHLRARGSDIRVRKYRLSPGNHLAMFIGDGLERADRILKDPEAVRPFAVTSPDAPLPPLDGLSCRWEPLQAVNGSIASLIIKPAGGKTLPEIMGMLADVLGFNPLDETAGSAIAENRRLRFRFPPRGLGTEVRLVFSKDRLRGLMKGYVEGVLFLWGYLTGLRVGPFHPKRYMKELSLNTDHRKVGDSLQLVLDLTQAQLTNVRERLSAAYEAGHLVYGLHVSREALMTCFVEDIGNSRHIHFVDGADGGLSLAAAEFKKRQAGHATAISENYSKSRLNGFRFRCLSAEPRTRNLKHFEFN